MLYLIYMLKSIYCNIVSDAEVIASSEDLVVCLCAF